MTLTVTASDRDGATVLRTSGDIDVQTASQLRSAFDEVMAADIPRVVVLDLDGTDFLDSSALGVLVGVNKQLDAAGSKLRLVCDKPHLLKVFEITRLRDVVIIAPTIKAALS